MKALVVLFAVGLSVSVAAQAGSDASKSRSQSHVSAKPEPKAKEKTLTKESMRRVFELLPDIMASYLVHQVQKRALTDAESRRQMDELVDRMTKESHEPGYSEESREKLDELVAKIQSESETTSAARTAPIKPSTTASHESTHSRTVSTNSNSSH